MGYYTYFTLTTHEIDKSINLLDIIKWLDNKRKENEAFFYPFSDSIDELVEETSYI